MFWQLSKASLVGELNWLRQPQFWPKAVGSPLGPGKLNAEGIHLYPYPQEYAVQGIGKS
jgi:hypothetical protein